MFKSIRSKVTAMVTSAFALVAATSANAAVTLPTSDILADIGLVLAFVVAIGAAVLGLIYAAKAFGWAKRAG